jgi:putative ABC transport system permease protein
MKNYFRNLRRDMLKNRSAYLGAILIVALGILIYLAMNDFTQNLHSCISRYYEETEFADVFAEVRGIPESELSRLENIEGIETVSGRASADARLMIEDSDEIITVHLIGYSPDDRLNRVVFGNGAKMISPDSIFIGKEMSRAYGFREGSRVRLAVNGKISEFSYVSRVSEPEYLVMDSGTSAASDFEHYDLGVIDEAVLETLSGKKGIVSELGFRLKKGYSFQAVQNELTQALSPYGVSSITDRKHQTTDSGIQSEMHNYRMAGTIVPLLFILCSMFMLYIILKKLVNKDRPLIGTMKAMGAGNADLLKVYLFPSVLIGLSGSLIGIAGSVPLGNYLLQDDIRYYGLPDAAFVSDPASKLLVIFFAVLACFITVFLGVSEIVNINPADAMRAEAPSAGGKFTVPPALKKFLNMRQIIGLRSLFRNPTRSIVTIFAVSISFGMIANFISYRVVTKETNVDTFGTFETYDVNISLGDLKKNSDAASLLDGLPYVQSSETAAVYTVLLRNRNHSRYDTLTAINRNSAMIHLSDRDNVPHPLPASGLVMGKLLAEKLGVSVGDEVEVENGLLSDRPVKIPVSDILDSKSSFAGGCFMSLENTAEAFDADDAVNLIYVKMDRNYFGDLKRALKNTPGITSLMEQDKVRKSYEEGLSLTMNMMYVFCAFSIFLGIIMITNITNISVRERLNEFGTLMILGTTQSEVDEIILFEHEIDFILGILSGFPMAFVWKKIIEYSLSSDNFRLVMEIPPGVYLTTFLICFAIMLFSTVLVLRNVRAIRLTDILKERG